MIRTVRKPSDWPWLSPSVILYDSYNMSTIRWFYAKNFISIFQCCAAEKLSSSAVARKMVFRVPASYLLPTKDKLYSSVVIDEQFIIPPWYDINWVWYQDRKVPSFLILELSQKRLQGLGTSNQCLFKVNDLDFSNHWLDRTEFPSLLLVLVGVT